MRTLCALIALAALPPLAAATPRTDGCPAPGETPMTRPDPDGTPTKVRVGLWINDISLVDDVRQSFTANFNLLYAWRDPRVGDGARTERLVCPGLLDSVWHPLLLVANGRALNVPFEATGILPSGELVVLRRLQGQLSSPLDLRRFPFDEQTLSLSVEALEPAVEVELEAYPEFMGGNERLLVPGWRVMQSDVETERRASTNLAEEESWLHYHVRVGRDRGYFLSRLFLPLSLIVLMSWTAFWIDPTHTGSQIGVATTSMLTLIAFQISQSLLLPRISYLTLADEFVLTSSVIVFLALAEVILTSRLSRKGKDPLARRIDRHARWLFPGAYVTVLAVFLAT